MVFDETHFGIEESGSIAGLARRYKLQGLIAGLLVLVALFIWNQSVSFPPPAEFASGQEKQVLSADARSTFPGLIARHLTPQALMESCVAEWNRVKHQQRITSDLPAKADSVETYRQLQENLPKRSRRLWSTPLDQFQYLIERVKAEVGKVIIGQHAAMDQALIVILARQHALIEGVPGIAKTLLTRTLAYVLGCPFGRIQFTPDLMPG